MSNVLIEQYGVQKLKALRQSPYACLLDSDIQHTPHQIAAFIAALESLNNGGIILADEVGLGKTIEAGLVLKYLINNGAKRILIAMPPPLRKQWQVELKEKFGIEAVIPESKYAVEKRDKYDWERKMYKQTEPLIIITSYSTAPWFISKFPNVRWDCFVFDEAHRLRNYPNTKMSKALFNATRKIPKVMLTATPMQNYLRDLFSLAQFVDERIFLNESVFEERYVKTEDYKGLREVMSPILHRTLRKDVAKYLKFTNRDCMTVDFELTQEEGILYQLANEYLRRPKLFAVNASNNGLVKMVIRKLLASSSFAVVETFEVLRDRLLILKEDTKVEKADISLKDFFSLIDDDSDDAEDYVEEDIEQINLAAYRAQIDDELKAIEQIIKIAESIKTNSKAQAVIDALTLAFEVQREKGYPEKALIFTESKRTQRYLKQILTEAGFSDILTFNGELNDPEIKKIYLAWRGRFPKYMENNPSVDLKHAIVDYFEKEAKILIATDVASEGLNLQFCDTVINYDLPWNPMKIEQRIGRCHRFGQKRDVWVYNLLNRQNAADARVYEILEKKFNLFKGAFGASDDALGLLESGSNFEKRVMEIYLRCSDYRDFKREFDKLEREITAKRNNKYHELKELLNQVGSGDKAAQFQSICNELQQYVQDRDRWEQISGKLTPMCSATTYYFLQDDVLQFDNGNLEYGYILMGCICNRKLELLAPLLCVYDEDGEPYPLSEEEIINQVATIPQDAFEDYKPYKKEVEFFGQVCERIAAEFKSEYSKKHEKDIEQHKKKLENWVENRRGQYNAELTKLNEIIEAHRKLKELSTNFQQKIDIQKQIDKFTLELSKKSEKFHSQMSEIEKQAEKEEQEYIAKLDIDPLAIPYIIVKF